MKNVCSRIVVMAIFCFGISSCSKNDAIPAVVALIDPADANALSMAVTIPGGNRLSGTMPAATGGLQIPVVKSLVSNVITANGTAAPFLYTYSNITGNPGGYYVQIAGSAYYFNVPYAGRLLPTDRLTCL